MNQILTKVPLFAGLDEAELAELTNIITERQITPGELIVKQHTTDDEVYIILDGTVEVFIEVPQEERILVLLGKGQVVGELALIDQGYRSASARASRKEACLLAVLNGPDFRTLCERNYHIGFMVMRNLASDVAFKLRHRNLADM
ncbi:MAG: cyclic nucleotide-binding domain-containing protein [Chloroflexi bacterium]|nr:cyclic nucleotide-binding domain-containing protein [Chloroflexota bacterium]MBP8060198.1 cyclic nucleotide-binding domain-containing protein [Chloroflexota bacterium]